MKRTVSVFTVALLCLLSSYFAFAQGAQHAAMTFFVTSDGMGNGGNLGGLAGADAYCQKLALAAGGVANKTWHAYLSTQASGGQPAVNARDRIGKGPWINADGAEVASSLAPLHGDDDQGSIFNRTVALTEKGGVVLGDRHDILTGSQENGRAFTDGMDHTCNSWTSNGPGSAQVGHSDRVASGGGGGGGVGGGGGSARDRGEPSWNSSHGTSGCSQEAIVGAGGGKGMFYCFAIN